MCIRDRSYRLQRKENGNFELNASLFMGASRPRKWVKVDLETNEDVYKRQLQGTARAAQYQDARAKLRAVAACEVEFAPYDGHQPRSLIHI